MKFVDYATITVRSGHGGAGSVHFRREKFTPKGGPDGGDGGEGGSVILEADDNLYTLLDLRYNRHHFAPNGQPGGGALKSGKSGEDIILRVPPGTVARESETDEVVGEVNESGERFVLAKGGRGGKGNAFFKSATNQTPRFSQPGEPGEEKLITLELKLLADVGLVGLPNAGKSTLISSISAARPKVADYPFTTLEPALGVVAVEDYKSFVMADIPGIIEGAHGGKGLGLQFLKHIERNAVLLFLIPVTTKDLAGEYEVLLSELRSFNPELLDKPRILALSKTDLLPPEERALLPEIAGEEFPEDLEVMPISSVAGFGLERLKRRLWDEIQEQRRHEEPAHG
ncbi:MAG: GTPase ObgE [Rhodothermales bacterium]